MMLARHPPNFKLIETAVDARNLVRYSGQALLAQSVCDSRRTLR